MKWQAMSQTRHGWPPDECPFLADSVAKVGGAHGLSAWGTSASVDADLGSARA
jgi:hypothetical protein